MVRAPARPADPIPVLRAHGAVTKQSCDAAQRRAPDGRKTLVIWRKLPGSAGVPPACDRDGRVPSDAPSVEQDSLVHEEWFTKQGYSAKDSAFDLIYVNGGNNLENLKAPDDP